MYITNGYPYIFIYKLTILFTSLLCCVYLFIINCSLTIAWLGLISGFTLAVIVPHWPCTAPMFVGRK